MNKNNKIGVVSIIILLLILTIVNINFNETSIFQYPTRTPIPEEWIDRSWLTGDPCAPPCWYGLVPGESTEEDVMEFIYTSPLIIPSKIEINHYPADKNNPKSYNHITANMRFEENHNHYQIWFITYATDTLIRITEGVQFDFRVRDAVELFGPPDLVWSEPTVEIEECFLEMLWKDQQITLTTDTFDHSEFDKYCRYFNDNGLVPADAKLTYISILSYEAIIEFQGDDSYILWSGYLKEE